VCVCACVHATNTDACDRRGNDDDDINVKKVARPDNDNDDGSSKAGRCVTVRCAYACPCVARVDCVTAEVGHVSP
jgi:hypothetical protein